MPGPGERGRTQGADAAASAPAPVRGVVSAGSSRRADGRYHRDHRLHQDVRGDGLQTGRTAAKPAARRAMPGIRPMNDLQAAQAFLSAAMLRDPVLALANVVAWLDPYHFHTSTLDGGLQHGTNQEDACLSEAVHVC